MYNGVALIGDPTTYMPEPREPDLTMEEMIRVAQSTVRKYWVTIFSVTIALTSPSASGQAAPYYLIAPMAENCGLRSDGPSVPFSPLGLALDATGNTLLLDQWRRICKVGADGAIQILASGVGNSGSGIYQTSALAVDRFGNVFFSESPGIAISKGQVLPPARVVMLTPTGVVSEVHNTSASALTTDFSGNLYVAVGNQIIRRTPTGVETRFAGGTTGFSGDGGLAISAALNGVTSMTFDSSGSLYIVDGTRIRRVSLNGVITTLISESGPLGGLAVDSNANLYSSLGSVVKRYTPQGGSSTIAGGGGGAGFGGPATLVGLDTNATSLAVNSVGDIVFSARTSARRLVQAPRPSTSCQYSSTPTSVYINPEGGSGSFQIFASATDCPWLSESLTSWASTTRPGVVVGNGVINFTAEPNLAAAGRSTTLWAAGLHLAINQGGTACDLGFKQNPISIPAEGQTTSIVVTSNLADCAWAASSTTPWIFFPAAKSGTGTGLLSISVAANDSAALRTGEILFSGRTLTIRQAAKGAVLPSLTRNGVTNAASGIGGSVSPGEFIALYGFGLGPIQGIASANAIQGLGGTKVLVNGQEAYLTYSSFSQVNFLVPNSVSPISATVEVEYQLLRNTPLAVNAVSSQPGIFSFDGSGTGNAVAANEDGSLNSKSKPASPGSVVALWLTGQGKTLPLLLDGQQPPSGQYPKPVLPLSVEIGGSRIPDDHVYFAGLVYSGVLQVNLKVPQSVKSGDVELLVRLGDGVSRSGVTLAIGP